MDQGYLGQWQRVCARLRSEFGDAAYNSWLRPLKFERIDDGMAYLQAPTRFMRDWVLSHYGERIRTFWQAEDNSVREIEIAVYRVSRSDGLGDGAAGGTSAGAAAHDGAPASGMEGSFGNTSPGAAPHPIASGPAHRTTRTSSSFGRSPMVAPAAIPALSSDPQTLRMGSSLDSRYQFDSFVVGKSNELAYAAARRVADTAQINFNPLFLYGGVGLGKTHLMHAIAWHIRERDPGREVIYLSAERFMYQFVRALRDKDTMAFKQIFRSADVLMIDDVQFFSRKDTTQEEFFHTFNELVDQNKQIVISADRSPSDLEDVEERIRSRLGWGLVVDIHQTDFELRLGILEAKLARANVGDFPPKVLEFLAHRITSNIRELEGALNRLIAHSHLVGRPINLEMTQEALQDLLRANDRRVTIEEIQKKVAQHFNIRLADMHSARRARAVARPRQVAMYLAKQLTTRSLPEIGRKFGGRDHTTVMHAVKRIEELRQTDAALAEDIDLLRRMLEG
ncbi:MAG: chromosomal replication initiator protein DnaA [Alphaproteobacteria bacterium]|nr:chromosomal replication initiator protein DnaA [Alphaproteobacteria bacterium]